MRLNRMIWNSMSIMDKVQIFLKKYKRRDPALLYDITEHIKYNRYSGDIIFDDNSITHFKEVDIEVFAEEWVTNSDENLKPLVHYELLTDAIIDEAILYGKDFLLSHDIDYSITKYEHIVDLYNKRSIYSSEWGPYGNFKDTEIHDSFFTCKCEDSKGKTNLGMNCPTCNTPVKERDFSVDRFGYFRSHYNVKFLTPIGYKVLSRILNGPTQNIGILDYIIGTHRMDDKPSTFAKVAIAKRYKNKYLYDYVEDLINESLTAKKRESNSAAIKHFLSNKDSFFLSYIPVISTAFRKMSYTQSFGVEKIEAHNDLNHVLTQISTALNKHDLFFEFENNNEKYKSYYTVTKYTIELHNSIYRLTALGKHSYIRSCVMGQRQNSVIMAVLEPLDRGLTEDQCIVSYRHLLALRSRELEVWLLAKGIPPHKIHIMLNHNRMVKESTKKLLHEYIEKHMVVIEYNRQPTIRMQSSLPLTIVGLTDKPVLFVHPTTAKKPNADHDKNLSRLYREGIDEITLRIDWKELKTISPAGSRKSEEKYIV